MSNAVDLYDNVYGDFASDAEAAVHLETHGEDIDQGSLMTAGEWLRSLITCRWVRQLISWTSTAGRRGLPCILTRCDVA